MTFKSRYDLGSVVEIHRDYNNTTFFIFGHDIRIIDPRGIYVYATLKDTNEEIWIDTAKTPEEAKKMAEEFASVVGSMRMNPEYVGGSS